MYIFDCAKVAETIKGWCRSRMENYLERFSRPPKLVVIQVGDNQASNAYVRNKVKCCVDVGIASEVIKFPESADIDDVRDKILELNNDTSVDGILLQLPLPRGWNEHYLINFILPSKDVDCLTPANQHHQTKLPCTPAGVIRLLEYEEIPIKGKHIVILGRSNLVGRPLAETLSKRTYDATVTLCNSHTENLEGIIASADIVISCVGKRGLIKNGMLAPHAILIDVGINRDEEGKLIGDAERDVECLAKTPVPRGVGLLTVASLMSNTVDCWIDNQQS